MTTDPELMAAIVDAALDRADKRTVPGECDAATRANLADQLRQVIARLELREQKAEGPQRRDLICRRMGLLSALHLIDEGTASNTREEGNWAGSDEDADPEGGFDTEPPRISDDCRYPDTVVLGAEVLRMQAEIGRLKAANDRAWDVVQLLRYRAMDRGDSPYSDPIGQLLSAALVGDPSHEEVRAEVQDLTSRVRIRDFIPKTDGPGTERTADR